MSAPSSSLARRAAAVVLVVVALVLAGSSAPALSAPRPAGQAPTTGADGGTPDIPTSGPGVADPASSDDAAEAAAQERADADLWSVWQVVIALAGVTLALLVLLVLYVRATSPRRSGAGAREEAPFLAVIAADLGVAAEDDAGGEDRVPVAVGAVPADPAPAPSTQPAATRPPADPAPAPAPARRTKRVEAPAKKLATPDAERVLVRPGRTPIRVPGPALRSDGPPPAAPSPPSGAGDGR